MKINYQILSNPKPEKLEEQVTIALNAGWKLAGGLVATYPNFLQSVYKEEENETQRTNQAGE